MEIKKSPKADLERGKSLSILMGFVVGLAVLFVGFMFMLSMCRSIAIATCQDVGENHPH